MLKKLFFALTLVGQVAYAQNLELCGMTHYRGADDDGVYFLNLTSETGSIGVYKWVKI